MRAGQHRQAVDQLSWTVRTHPEYVNAYIILAMALAEDQQLEDALIMAERGVALTGGASFTLAARGHYLARLGRFAEANRVLNELMVRSDASPTLLAAEVYNGLRDPNAVFFWLNKGIEQHDVNMTLLAVDRANLWLRPDSRFRELRQKMHLPEIDD